MKQIGKQYFETLDETITKYFNILSEEVPEYLYEYIGTPEMQKQARISVTCGTCYSKLFNIDQWYSSLDHSVAVALIVYNFTKDKKQTLAALLHDIATPVFKHCVDFMNGDHENQESTEEMTTKIISESKEIMNLLERDGIKLEEVADYHIYPIADNDTPKLSADRLEYTLSNGLGVITKLWKLEDIKEVYNNIEVQKNEDGIEELGFKDKKIAEKFVNIMSKLSAIYVSNECTFSMQFLADIMKKLSENNLISVQDLYTLSEKEIIDKIENCKLGDIANCFKIWKNSTELLESDEFVEEIYCINGKNKRRYIVPLVNEKDKYVRINDISSTAKEDIDVFLKYKPKKYCYLKFDKDFGVKNIEDNLKKYIIENVFPEYNKNENGHGIQHINYVINRSFELIKQNNLNVNNNMVYVIAAYHDIGHHIDPKKHEQISADMMSKDEDLKQFFSQEELTIIKEAIEDHRASADHEPRSIYGKIVSSADRNSTIEQCLERPYYYGKNLNPNATERELQERSFLHLNKKFGVNGYAKNYLIDEQYEEFLRKLRELLTDKEEFCRIQAEHIKNIEKNKE